MVNLQALADLSPIKGQVYAQRLAEFAWSGAQVPHIISASSSLHSLDTIYRLKSSDEHCTCPIGIGSNIDTVIRSVNVIDINVTIRREHYLGTTGSAVGMRRRVIRVCLYFDDASGHITYGQEASDEFGRDFQCRRREELATETAHGGLILDNLWKT
jgi:hypothetical protein